MHLRIRHECGHVEFSSRRHLTQVNRIGLNGSNGGNTFLRACDAKPAWSNLLTLQFVTRRQ